MSAFVWDILVMYATPIIPTVGTLMLKGNIKLLTKLTMLVGGLMHRGDQLALKHGINIVLLNLNYVHTERSWYTAVMRNKCSEGSSNKVTIIIWRPREFCIIVSHISVHTNYVVITIHAYLYSTVVLLL